MQPLPLLVTHPDEVHSVKHLAADLRLTQEERQLALDLYFRRLPPLPTRTSLPYLFGVSNSLIGAMQKWPIRYYRLYSIAKSSGGERTIEAPRIFLKLVQTWINAHICSQFSTPDYVMGFKKRRSIFTNAEVHARNRNLMVVDIEEFFPSTRHESVVKAFASFRFPPDVCRQLANLCCIQKRLPQGAPTSPALSNVVFAPVDEILNNQAAEWKCRYTRYADDLAFSGGRRFTSEDISRVKEVLSSFGYRANDKKTRIVGPGGRKLVAGLVVNSRPLPPRTRRRLWRAIFHRASKHPKEFADRIAYLSGVAAFVNQYSNRLANEYRSIVESIRQEGRPS